MSHKIVFFGNERLATGVSTQAPVLRALAETGDYEIAAVILAQKPVGKSRKKHEVEIMAVAEEFGITVQAPDNLRDQQEVNELKAFEAEIGVLVAYGKIVPQAIIDIFPRGIVNIHPSALPKHRGPTPLESVMLAGETQTAVTLMQLAAKMDAGPIYAQQTVELSGSETKQELADKLVEVGRGMLINTLPAILDGSIEPSQQNDQEASYDKLIEKSDAELDWQKPAKRLEREIRAYAGWPKSRTDIGGREVVITKVHVIDGNGTSGVIWLQDKQLGMHTSEGILVIDELVPVGKKTMTGSDFLLGYKPAV